jgi:hypothetical protein
MSQKLVWSDLHNGGYWTHLGKFTLGLFPISGSPKCYNVDLMNVGITSHIEAETLDDAKCIAILLAMNELQATIHWYYNA